MLKKLLLADDSLTIQKVVGIVFANLDYQLLIADNGDAALALARKEFPDLIIADIGMPGMDGFDLCREIKNDTALCQTPVLLLPGVFENFDEKKAVAVGAEGWLTKPFESQALISKVEELLAAVPAIAPAAVIPGLGDSEPMAIEAASPFTEESAPVLETEAEFGSFDAPLEETVDFETPEPFGGEEAIELEVSDALAGEDAVSFEDSPLADTDIVDFAAPEETASGSFAEAASVSFELPVVEELPADAGDDIWDAVTFEEQDLQSESILLEEKAEESNPLEELLVATPASEQEEPALVEEEPALVEEESVPVSSAASAVEEELEDEILELGDDDIIELGDDAIIDDVSVDAPAGSVAEFEFPETPVETIVDFAAPSLVEPEPVFEPEPEPVFEPEPELIEMVEEIPATPSVGEEVFVGSGGSDFEFADEPSSEDAAAVSVPVDVAGIAAQLEQLDPAVLEDIVRRVAGPIVEKMAAQMLEGVIWEVVPDLAESMIKDEIRKIKDGAN